MTDRPPTATEVNAMHEASDNAALAREERQLRAAEHASDAPSFVYDDPDGAVRLHVTAISDDTDYYGDERPIVSLAIRSAFDEWEVPDDGVVYIEAARVPELVAAVEKAAAHARTHHAAKAGA